MKISPDVLTSALHHYDEQEARLPFMLADCVVVAALHFVERGMKKEREMRDLQSKQEYNKMNETKKNELAALKQAQRDEQKRSNSRNKMTHHYSKSTPAHNIQQPVGKKVA